MTLVAAAAIFYKIGTPAVYLWDEARLAVSALEMMGSGNPLVVTFGGEPDLLNTKPPLPVVLSAISMALLGMNELALRLPAAAAATLTVLAVYLFTRRQTGRVTVAVLAALILLGIGGFNEVHVARTADPDAFLVLFTTLATFSLFRAVETIRTDRGRAARHIYVAATALGGALLTKSIAAFLLLPGIAAYLAVAPQGRRVFRLRATALAGVALVAFALLFLVLRETAQPGYLAAVRDDQLLRAVEPLQPYGWHYYLKGLVWPWQLRVVWGGFTDVPYSSSALPWSIMLPIAAYFGVSTPAGQISRLSRYLLVTIVCFLVVLSVSATRLSWYVAPAFPLMAVLTAAGLAELARRLERQNRLPNVSRAVMPAALVLAIATAAFNVWKNEQVVRSAWAARDQRLPTFVRDVARQHPDSTPIAIISDAHWPVPVVRNGRVEEEQPYDGATQFYALALRQSGQEVRFVGDRRELREGDLVIACGDGRSMILDLPMVHQRGECAAARYRIPGAEPSQTGGRAA